MRSPRRERLCYIVDPRGGPDLDPLWLMLDVTPAGRGTDWYPKLDYGHHA